MGFFSHLFQKSTGSDGMVWTKVGDNEARWMPPQGGGGSSSYTLPIASESTLGGIKVGNNLSIDVNGVLSASDTDTVYTLPTASESTLGGIKVGNNLSIDENGVLSATGSSSSSSVSLTVNTGVVTGNVLANCITISTNKNISSSFNNAIVIDSNFSNATFTVTDATSTSYTYYLSDIINNLNNNGVHSYVYRDAYISNGTAIPQNQLVIDNGIYKLVLAYINSNVYMVTLYVNDPHNQVYNKSDQLIVDDFNNDNILTVTATYTTIE